MIIYNFKFTIMAKFTKTKEWLIEEYLIKGRSRKEIAAECGLSEAGLKSLLAKFEIKKEKLNISKEKLEELINQKLNHQEIEKILGIGQTTLYRYLKKYNLNILVETSSLKYDDTYDELLCQLYLDGFSTTDLSKEFKISHKTVINHLQHCGVPRRTLSEAQWTFQNKEIPAEFDSYEVMYDLYITQSLSKQDLAIKFNCDPCVIDRVLKSYNISIRNNSESKIGILVGEKHPNWKGGITPLGRRLREFFGVNQTLKVLKRDNYTCQCCGSKKDLHVHHKIPFHNILNRILKEHPDLDPIININELYNIAVNDKEFKNLDNLITYCHDCHFYKIHDYTKK